LEYAKDLWHSVGFAVIAARNLFLPKLMLNLFYISPHRCMNVPKFQITEELFAYTLNRLRKFEDILFFERFNETYETFARHVGWSQTPTPSSLNHSAYSYPPIGSKHYAWEPHMTTLDDALFEYAVGLYEAEVQPPKISKLRVQRLQDYMAKGPMYMCTSPCCSAECSEY
jgi:hypothetical protein